MRGKKHTPGMNPGVIQDDDRTFLSVDHFPFVALGICGVDRFEGALGGSMGGGVVG
jgi:hypothetical protein